MKFKIKLDYLIITCIFLLCIASCLFIYSSSSINGQYVGAINFVYKQIIFYIVGFILIIFISQLDAKQIKAISLAMYFILFISLIGLIFAPESIARPVNGAKAWYQIPFIGTFQPSEFLKFSFLIITSWIVVHHNTKYEVHTFKSDILLLLKIGILTLPPVILVYIQPDTGMILLYVSMLFPMLFFSGIQKRILISILGIPLILISFIVTCYLFFHEFYQNKILSLLSPHQISRINGWLDPFNHGDSAYQTKQALLAIGSGEIYGKGFMKNNVYIPEKHTDFIFANIAEETGFLGASVIIILLFILIFRFVQIALLVNTQFAILLISGIIGLLSFQVFQNVGMTIGLLPVTGVTLPFLSYGGSSLLSNMMLVGIIISIKNSYRYFMFENTGEEE
ncbi:FtsW/RodA/SpoVE family cell cycle protein [Metasolibacillus sp.]|uniref:FtsW/RodA/SpoVE family cell cycle protein n=1 Tax=Metasolibacillus sp. TaxID=2703680 RepID=UPI0025F131DD|nr:FtsW/RodA/SpoVE family cell cycle protein [Metasolibacillus sp.]MCT6923340.1 FtsW/RodA/SpoVE family cell cycle protein [Metasolibacillus sp.]MCT6939355.1 FtsW/RodA/SpoVE family cell cycle protein [Metasolibacillus sp.]